MCLKLCWIRPRPPPIPSTDWQHTYTGAGATLAALLGTTVAQLGRTTKKKDVLTSQIKYEDIMLLYRRAKYNRGHVNIPFTTFTQEGLKDHLIELFHARLSTATVSHEQKLVKLRMKVAVGLVYKRPKVNKSGREHYGQVVAFECWTKQDQVLYRIADYCDNLKGKRAQLPRDEQVQVFWCLDPIFYYCTRGN